MKKLVVLCSFLFCFTFSTKVNAGEVENLECHLQALANTQWEDANYGFANEAQWVMAYAEWYHLCMTMP